MKIIHIGCPQVNSSFDSLMYGGLNRFLEDFICYQNKRHDVTLVYPPPEVYARVFNAELKNDDDALINIGLEVIPTLDADIYHIHDWYGAITLNALYSRGIRNIVMTSHLPLRRGFTYRDTCLDWETKYLLEEKAMKCSKLIVSPSQYNRAFIISEYGIIKKKIRVVPHGIDFEIFKPVTSPMSHSFNPTILFVGRLTEQKAPELLIRALPRIIVSFPNIQLVVVGAGSRLPDVQNLISKLNLHNHVILKGAISKADLPKYYSETDLFVLPSQFEPFGLVGLEAMACGCPVLSIAPSGAEDYLDDHEITSEFSPQRLGGIIVKRLKQIQHLKNHKADLIKRAQHFNWPDAVALYDNVYMDSLE
ncbi:glycosyltransferase family 4 protein [bacterium]|nr:glycosyltransferase family 4 protein [bacterium]